MFYSHRLHTYLDSIHFVVATWSSVLAVCKHAKHEVARTCHGLTDARTRPIVSRYNRERERERERNGEKRGWNKSWRRRRASRCSLFGAIVSIIFSQRVEARCQEALGVVKFDEMFAAT